VVYGEGFGKFKIAMGEKELEFKETYESNYPKVMRLCLGYVNGDYDSARDLAQEVFIKVWDNLYQFREESKIATWIYRITVNTCLGQLRKDKKKIKNIRLETASDYIDSESEIDKEQMLSKLYACINKLSETNKAIILLELEDLPQNEIASIMGISHEALRTRIHRIKNQLSKCAKNDKF
jgi:RNA polymerase sigma-70 factor (ECF subfamily)